MRWPHMTFIPRYNGPIPWAQQRRFFGYETGVNWIMLRVGRFIIKAWIA